MPDELGDELRALFAQEDERQEGAPAEMLSAVLAGAGRRRRSRTMLTVAASTVGALAIGGASWAVTSSAMRTEPVDQPKPVITVTAEPTPDASAGDVRGETDPGAMDLDGILDDEYPEAAPARATMPDNEFDIPVVYPDALVMEDWVWDRVGEGWSVATVGLPDAKYPVLDYEIPPAVLYLVSPEDVYFEVAELPEQLWDGVRVVSWDESDQTVRLSFGGLGDSGAVYDMRTGEWEEIIFASYGANADANEFVAADAAGNELWSARSENGTKLYRWDADAEEWAASVLVEQAPEASAVQGGLGRSWFAVSEEGDRVILDVTEGEAWTQIIVYSVTDDTLRTLVAPSVDDAWALEGRWVDESSAWFTAISGEKILVDLGSGDFTSPSDPPSSLREHTPSTTWMVGYGMATDGDVTYRDCGC